MIELKKNNVIILKILEENLNFKMKKKNKVFKLLIISALDKSKSWLRNQNLSEINYDNKILANRVLQSIYYSSRFCEELNFIYYDKKQNYDLVNSIEEFLEFEKFKINIKTGSIIINLKVFIKLYLKFQFDYFKLLLLIIKSIFIKKTEKKTYSILWDPLNKFSNYKKKIIYKLKKSTHFLKISKNNFLIIKSNFETSEDYKNKIIFSKNPIIYLFNNTQTCYQKLTFLKFFFLKYLSLNSILLKNKYLIFMYKDFLYEDLVKKLNEQNIIQRNIFTVVNISNQPLWSRNQNRKPKTIFFWNTPTLLISFKIKNEFKNYFKYIEYINVDEHIVWHKKFKKFFSKGSKVRITKLITLDLPSNSNNVVLNNGSKIKINKKDFNISVFDVNPVENYRYKNFFIKPIESLENIKIFFENIIKVIDKIKMNTNKNINIFIKVKGSKNSLKDKYTYFLNKISKENRNVFLLDSKNNVLDLIKFTDLSITYPISSIPAHEYIYAKRKGIFFDPNNIYKTINLNGSILLKNTIQLEKKIRSFLKR